MQRLNDSSPERRRAACEALGQIGDPRAIEPLVLRAMTENDQQVLDAVNAALKQLKPEQAA
ncbi:MAG: HEAT repeat domain-containing protein [Armatimonadota bacterium]